MPPIFRWTFPTINRNALSRWNGADWQWQEPQRYQASAGGNFCKFFSTTAVTRTIQFIKMLDPCRELSRLLTRIGHTAVKGNFSAKIKGDRTWLESLMIMSTCKSTRGHKLNNNNKHLPTFKGMLLVSTFSQLTHSKISRRVTCGMKNLRQTEREILKRIESLT